VIRRPRHRAFSASERFGRRAPFGMVRTTEAVAHLRADCAATIRNMDRVLIVVEGLAAIVTAHINAKVAAQSEAVDATAAPAGCSDRFEPGVPRRCESCGREARHGETVDADGKVAGWRRVSTPFGILLRCQDCLIEFAMG